MEVVPGDQWPLFMERSIRENDFILIICTPERYHKKTLKIAVDMANIAVAEIEQVRNREALGQGGASEKYRRS
jgi:hypothetical protein